MIKEKSQAMTESASFYRDYKDAVRMERFWDNLVTSLTRTAGRHRQTATTYAISQADTIAENNKVNMENRRAEEQRVTQTLTLARAHFKENSAAIIDIAIEEARTEGIEIEYSGEIALNIQTSHN